MNYSYIIIDDNQESVLKTKGIADGFPELTFVASANNYTDGLHLVLQHTPQFIFLEIDPADLTSNLSLSLINELHRYLKIVPKIIVTTNKKELAFEAIQHGVTDYLLKPLLKIDLVKLMLKLNKSEVDSEGNKNEAPSLDEKITFLPQIETVHQGHSLTICIKSYGDYRYIDAKDISHLRADNNSTDIYLNNGEMITAFKTLKHFEEALSYPFIRIHNSYIVNRNYISRIHSGNAVCYIKNSSVKLPFSKSYKANIDLIISEFANGNYLEI